MPLAWFIVPYVREADDPRPVRYCQIDDQTELIMASGGMWQESEVLGNRAVVKVRASASVLTTLDGLHMRLPKDSLEDSLSDLSVGNRDTLTDELLNMGYGSDEIASSLGNDVRTNTLGGYLNFAATRRLKPRYDEQTDEIILDGDVQLCKPIDDVDRGVS